MTTLRRLLSVCAVACAATAMTATPSSAIVGGSNASPGEYPAVSQITFGAFGCTGTLISPDTVLTAGHCSSLTGGAGQASPASWPAAAINVRIGNDKAYTGGETVPVSRVIMLPEYLLTDGYDISLLKLSRNATKTPVKVSGSAETGLWSLGTMETIVGWGNTSEGGSSPSTLQEAQVPVYDFQKCAAAYEDEGYNMDERTMICAGYERGGVDTCQGDSGGPLFGRTAGGVLRVVGATSFGIGCARANFPGVYARVGDQLLREWIRSNDADGVA